MGDITPNFDKSEFQCPHCSEVKINKDFVERLEILHRKMNAKCVIISSGYRCPDHSVAVGGYRNDAHVLGFGADLAVYKQDGNPYSSATVCRIAEQIGFGGIGIIDNVFVHLDSRDCNPFTNNHWFGNERTGETYKTFQDMPHEEIQGGTKHKGVRLYIDDKLVYSTKE